MKRVLASESVKHIGKKVKLGGWVSNMRDHGKLIFIDLRDWSGNVQIVVDEKDAENFKIAKELGTEYVISVVGKVVEREKSLVNSKIPTGNVEIEAEAIEIINKSKTLPFPLDGDGRDIDEILRLKYRFIDIRRNRVRNLIENRHKFILFTRNWFSDHGFVEVQTPLLTVSSPEGARDFLVPSRLYPGKFFALPQAPQQYKQLLMVGGMDKYFQIAPCVRDEDPRKDRHSGFFYQIDVECSFISEPQELFEMVEPFFKDAVEKLTNKKLTHYPFPQISYKDAMDIYGSDRPDLRFDLKLADLTKLFHSSQMEIFKKAEAVKGLLVDKEFTRSEIEDLTTKIKLEGAGGLAWFKLKDGEVESPIKKFFSDDQVKAMLDEFKGIGYKIKDNQTIFIVADNKWRKACRYSGWLRNEIAGQLGLMDPNLISFTWVVDFPMYTWDEDQQKWDFEHNPFSMPKGGIKALKEKDPGEISAYQYDIACNGYEISSGSVRNHEPETLIEAFKVIGYTEEEVRNKFGHMISAFEFGAPPHAGFAPGVDRLMMVLFDEPNVREVYAFPMANGQEPMTGAPREVDKKDLDVLGIQVVKKAK